MKISMCPAEHPAPDFSLREQAIPHEVIPDVLKEYPQWVCWRYVERGPDKKPDKRPINPHNLHSAGVNWPNTWSNFAHTYMVYLMHRARIVDGIGFVLTNTDDFVGLDLDRCLDQQGQLSPWAQPILDHLPSYTEVSPSGTGLRILVSCPEFRENTRLETLEVYSHNRFLTLTGHHVVGTPTAITSVQKEEIEALTPQSIVPPIEKVSGRTSSSVDNRTLWTRIFDNDHYGAQHLQRFQGDMSLDRGDHSLAVIRLLNCLARWTEGDAAKMREMMMLSPLANDKWFSKRGNSDWLNHQIRDAIEYTRGKC